MFDQKVKSQRLFFKRIAYYSRCMRVKLKTPFILVGIMDRHAVTSLTTSVSRTGFYLCMFR